MNAAASRALARLLTAVMLAVALLAAGCGEPPPRRPDVLLIVCDTLRADCTGLLDDADLTPELRALAARGTNFRQAVAPASWTLPSMAALFSGRDATGNRHAARADGPALAELFAQAGYATVGLSANPLLAAENGFARGLQSLEVAPAASVTDLRAHLADLRSWNADALVQRALRQAGEVPRDKPLFVWIQLMDAHVPYDPAHETAAPPRLGWSAPRDVPEGRGPPHGPPRFDAWREFPPPEARTLLCNWRRAYDGQVAFLDAAVGRLVAHWTDVRPGAPLVAVTSDHGEGLFDHAREPDSTPGPGPLGEAYPDHGEQLYEEALRVPLVLLGPGVPVRVEDRAVGTRDLGATLLRLCGLPAAGPTLPLAAAEPVPELLFGCGTRGWYVRSARRQLVFPFPERAATSGVQTLLLPVAVACLPQDENLAPEEPEAVAALVEALRDWLNRAGSESEPPLDAATRARLQQLGYLR